MRIRTIIKTIHIGTDGAALVGVCPGWMYRSDFDSCYYTINTTTVGTTMTWTDARTACQTAAATANTNTVTSGALINDADLVTISYGSAEETFIFTSIWKTWGKNIGWIGGNISNGIAVAKHPSSQSWPATDRQWICYFEFK